ncbi:phosphoribosylanthranilate isomerase [Hyphococcus flavus]|uniref:N-(5'-phosphoribosyl)anthranilate isomerase n=1 Tax=Hyphococcus flavus TaxID=1866326 RepID=A0AAE9ZDE4_9PROT|nr:phosphoribosylanthranilate isomerase [Hyphococcus flavus]WDI32919.1 phosphoribosylanthranilate isomerase [Hyphococcus flavus]
MSDPLVKICGVKDAETAIGAARAGADFLGFVFFRKSPRFVSAEAAEEIILDLKQASFDEGFAMPRLVGLFVDTGEKELSVAAPLLSHFQFHGHESAERCEELGAEFGVEVIRAIPVTGPDDVAAAKEFAEAADILLFDAKPPPGAVRPGGYGASFDWSALASYDGETPYLLAGGLAPENVADAIASQKDRPAFLGVDVSSGVESAPGVKDAERVKAFLAAAKK